MANQTKRFPEPPISEASQDHILDLIGTVINECQVTWNELTEQEKTEFSAYVGGIGAELAFRYGPALALGTLKMDVVIRRLEERAKGNKFIEKVINTVKSCLGNDDENAWLPK